MFETPPLEINLLRKASSYAWEVICNVSFSRMTLRSKPSIFQDQVWILGELSFPENPFPHQMEVQYARDDFHPSYMARHVP